MTPDPVVVHSEIKSFYKNGRGCADTSHARVQKVLEPHPAKWEHWPKSGIRKLSVKTNVTLYKIRSMKCGGKWVQQSKRVVRLWRARGEGKKKLAQHRRMDLRVKVEGLRPAKI